MPEVRFSRVELWVQSRLRVPPSPEPPEGSPESIQVFRSGHNYYALCLLVWFFLHLVALLGLAGVYLAVSRSLPGLADWAKLAWRIVGWLAVLAFTASFVFTFFAQRLQYALRWYILTDRSLRIRAGVFSVQELTMTFSNIQEIRVSADPLQNILQLADVEVHSAGGGAKSDGHIGRFTSVSNANEIRDLIVERLTKYRDSGLGEPTAHKDSTPDPMEAARAVLAEARLLRQQLTAN